MSSIAGWKGEEGRISELEEDNRKDPSEEHKENGLKQANKGSLKVMRVCSKTPNTGVMNVPTKRGGRVWN